MIDRLLTQRACLDAAAARVRDLDGPVFEIGLGKGRTYDHLRRLMPAREIFVFDRDIHAPADCRPDADHLTLGDFRQTLPAAARRIGARAVLIHADIGSEDQAADADLAAALAAPLGALLGPGGVALCDRALTVAGWAPLPAPEGAGGWPYFVYRAADPVQ